MQLAIMSKCIVEAEVKESNDTASLQQVQSNL